MKLMDISVSNWVPVPINPLGEYQKFRFSDNSTRYQSRLRRLTAYAKQCSVYIFKNQLTKEYPFSISLFPKL